MDKKYTPNKALRDAIDSAHLQYTVAAKKAGVDRNMLATLINYRTVLSYANPGHRTFVERICKIVGVDPETIWKAEPEQEAPTNSEMVDLLLDNLADPKVSEKRKLFIREEIKKYIKT